MLQVDGTPCRGRPCHKGAAAEFTFQCGDLLGMLPLAPGCADGVPFLKFALLAAVDAVFFQRDASQRCRGRHVALLVMPPWFLVSSVLRALGDQFARASI